MQSALITSPQLALLHLLRAALWQKPISVQEFPKLTSAQWDEVHDEAVRQTVVGIAYDGFNQLPEQLLPPDPLMIKWVAEADHIERSSLQANNVAATLSELFASQGLTPIVVKGQGLAQIYPSPLLRTPGDLDLYFPKRVDFEKARDIVSKMGVEIERDPDGSTIYFYDGVKVEHHPHLIDIAHPSRRAAVEKSDYCRPVILSLPTSSGEKKDIYIPNAVINKPLLAVHILKHIAGMGVGLRQLCDMAMLFSQKDNPYTSRDFQILFITPGIDKWYATLCSFVVQYLGVAPELIGKGILSQAFSTRPLLEIVMKGGNFGFHNPSHAGLSPWRRKLATAWSCIHHFPYTRQCAPKEAFWLLRSLLGQTLRL